MKAIILTSALVTLLFGCNTPDKVGREEAFNPGAPSEAPEVPGGKNHLQEDLLQYVISEGQVGQFNIGGNLPQSPDSYQVRKTQQVRLTEEGPVEEPAYVVSRNGNEMLILKPQYDHDQGRYNNKIGEIMVLSDQYRTKEGIGVNSTIAEFESAYPDFEIWYTYVSGRYIIEAAQLPAQFILDEKDFTGEMDVNSVKVILEKDDFREGTKIVKVRVYQ